MHSCHAPVLTEARVDCISSDLSHQKLLLLDSRLWAGSKISAAKVEFLLPLRIAPDLVRAALQVSPSSNK